MKNEKRPKPSAEDLYKLREFEKEQNGGPWTDEHMAHLNSYDWSPELFNEGDRYGLKNAYGEVILPAEFDDFRLLSSTIIEDGDRVVAMQNGKWGVVLADGSGTWLVKPEFDYIGYPNNITHVCKDELWGVMDIAKGEYLIAPECEYVDDYSGFMFMNGIGTYKKDGLYGVITDYGVFTEAIFEELDVVPEEWVKVKFNGEWGFIDENNQFTTDEDEANYNTDVD